MCDIDEIMKERAQEKKERSILYKIKRLFEDRKKAVKTIFTSDEYYKGEIK